MLPRAFLFVGTFLLAVRAACAEMPKTQSLPTPEPPRAALTSLTVFPPRVELTGPRAEQLLGVLGSYADGRTWELTRSARFTSDNPKVIGIESGRLQALADGQANVTVEAGGKKVVVPVTVTRSADAPVSFSSEVVPVFTRAGCNQGACHGSQHGRGGFKLSLLGYDPAFDHPQIVQSAEGRRVVLSDPERSILLLKPTLTLEHGGGERFKVGSREYNLLRRWLEDGAPGPSPRDASVINLEVWPAARLMVPGEQQQVIVRATWTDGRTTDVTPVAQFDALNESVAGISPAGLITAKGSGETHVMIRFMGQAVVVRTTLPYAKLDRPLDFAAHNAIDEKLKAKWQELGLVPSPLCSDEEFFRRIHLDAIGTLPSPEDVRAFLADKSKDKRKKAIDRVLDRPEFVDFWALKWGDLLRINRSAINDKGMWSFHNWVRASLRDNKPLDKMVREIITAEGSTFTQGPANYYRLSRTADDQAETTSMLFLGVRMQCARCHHHPFEKWSQDDYYGMVAFFTRLGSKNSQEFGLFGRETVIYLRPTGEATHPRKGGVVKPHPLGGKVMDDPFDRRRKLAEWMTSPENRFFARNFANRFWAYFMGRGLVEPLDDMRSTNPASNPELLDTLADELVKAKFDVKQFLRVLMNSRAYQLSSRPEPGNRPDAANTYYTRYTVKRLTAEQLADALDFATGTREKYVGLPLGTRAIQLPDTQVRSFLLDVFGRPARQITCECERTAQPNIAQALHLLNGAFLNGKIASPTGRLSTLLKAKKPLPTIIEEIYLVTLSRLPRSAEAAKAREWVAKAPSPREGLGDLLWVLFNSREFQFNH
jgi:Protein of unknown function (DUF1549)/Protein of unknown function (DUF1553)